MITRHRFGIAFACIVTICVVLIVYLRRGDDALNHKQQAPSRKVVTDTPSSSANPIAAAPPPPERIPAAEEIKQRKQQQLTFSYLTPISIFGKVVDENGSPVAGATVHIGIADKPIQSGSDYAKTTDQAGAFSLSGVHGIAFSVTASKEGYYMTDQSRGHRNVIVPGNKDLPQPTQAQPITLILRKQGTIEPLIAAQSGQLVVPTTGQPVDVDLTTGRLAAGGTAKLRLASWVGNPDQRPFDWRFQLSIPGGGLIEREGRFVFEAPVEEYKPAVEVNMPTTAEKWAFGAEKDYFAKLPDGRYARFSIRLYPGQRNFVVIESYVNPSGSRNLEYDPSKQASAR